MSGARPLYVFSGGFLGPGHNARRIRRILTLAGLPPRLGWPGAEDQIGVWGRTPIAARGEAVAGRTGAALIRVEDAFIRSLRPGRAGDAPMGLLIDRRGVHFDASTPSDLEGLLARHPLDDAALLARAHAGIARLIAADVSKYNIHDPAAPLPDPSYVLVIDQVRGDASVRHTGPGAASFAEILATARADHPNARIVIKAHPEDAHGLRPGHFGPGDAGPGMTLLTASVSPWGLLQGALAVYTLSSQMGFEAVLAGHRPQVFGRPFYAGWGLTEDRGGPIPRRGRRLTRAQMFAAAMLIYPTWYDPCRDRLCRFEDVLAQMEAEARAFREDRDGHVATGMRLWKRASIQGFFGRHGGVRFAAPTRAVGLAQRRSSPLLVWAGAETEALRTAATGVPMARVEDGFLRSRGLGAALVPACSLVRDNLGIYYDPSRESRLEMLIAAPPPPGASARAEALVARITGAGLSKYNIGEARLPPLPEGRRILVPGQVEDDASIHLGAGAVRTNLELLRTARAVNPGAVILYKPHPDVEAGLRTGSVPEAELRVLADAVLTGVAPAAAIAAVDEVWTITSLLGFEALLRGKVVVCLGAPFYAGWGLTRDLGPVPERRSTRPDLMTLAHAVLIAYPRYRDPISGLPCPPEVVADRLADGQALAQGTHLRALAKLQGIFASSAWVWRR
jgi:capsular polysaccharide export protein